MLFSSIEFALFLPLVFVCYWLLSQRLKSQNLFVVAISYLFYGWWDWRFLVLIAFTSLASFMSGIWIERYRDRGRASLHIATANVVLNLLILCLFKYFNFFSENLAQLFSLFGFAMDWVTVDLLLPVGISFYTFQALSYTIDVYRRRIEPTQDAVAFFAYVSFFPQLVAGPIERATNLLPQFAKRRVFDYDKAADGMRQLLWGFFKKMVIADNCALAVNSIFANYETLNASALLLGAIFFAFQIYGDFSGYSDIAIGTSRLFGIDLMRNFHHPYFSRDIAEFWRRWHISLTSWFREYIYIPLGGSRGGRWSALRNTMVIFLVSGFWHGASWTFVAWGAFNALLFMPLILFERNRRFRNDDATWRDAPRIIATFLLVCLGWIIFRSDNICQAVGYIGAIFSPTIVAPAHFSGYTQSLPMMLFILLAAEWVQRRKEHAMQLDIKSAPIRYLIYTTLIVLILLYSSSNNQFIYFQF